MKRFFLFLVLLASFCQVLAQFSISPNKHYLLKDGKFIATTASLAVGTMAASAVPLAVIENKCPRKILRYARDDNRGYCLIY